jgi:VWFA-related protein
MAILKHSPGLLVLLFSGVLVAQQPPAPTPAPAAPASPSPVTGAGRGQAPPAGDTPTFRTSTRLVIQNVTVKDKDGNPIEGLTAADFQVFEENQRQDIAFVEYQRLDEQPAPVIPDPTPADSVTANGVTADSVTPAQPARQTVAAAAQVDIVTPPPGTVRYQDKRLLVFYFDQEAMEPPDEFRAFTNAIKYVETQMTAADIVAVIGYSNGAVRVRQDFTSNRATLVETLVAMQQGDDLNSDGVADVSENGTAFGQGDREFNMFNLDRQLAALQTAVNMLKALPEQKTLIYFGSGLNLNGSDNMAQLSATTNAAIKANVTINPIDATGLVASAPMGDATQSSPGGTAMFSGQAALQQASSQLQSKDSLFALAKDTGGKAMFESNDLALGIEQAARAVSHYYIVAYYSTHTATDGKFRRVRVELTGNRQAQLSYRQGYYADKTFAAFSTADKERQLQEALMLGDPITEITIAMELNYFQLNRAEYFVPVAMKIPGSELTLARRRGAARTTIDFIGEIKDEYGFTIQNIRDNVDIKLSDEHAEQISSRPIQYDSGYTLLPGNYVIKVLARDATTGRIGTFQTKFTVPNLVREEKRVPISSVVLSSQRTALGDELYAVRQRAASDAVDPLVHDGHKLVPSVTRVFSVAADLHVFLQSYQRGATTMRPLVAFVAFYQGNDKVFESAPLAVVDGMHPKSKAIPMRTTVSLRGLTPGRYDCQVTVIDPETQKAAFWRAPVVLVP